MSVNIPNHDEGAVPDARPRHDQPPPPSYASLASPLPPPNFPAAPNSSNLTLHAAFDHRQAALGLPSGCFILRNRGSGGRVLDLLNHRSYEGAPVGLHPLKRPQVEEGDLQIKANNQIWFVGWDGLLYSAAVSRAIECKDGQLSVAIPRPVMSIPSQRSHPTSRFAFDPSTSTLHVHFASDPSFPGPPENETNWRDYEYLVEAVPQKKRNETGLWEVASTGIAMASKELFGSDGAAGLLGGLSGKLFGKSPVSSAPVVTPPPPPQPSISSSAAEAPTCLQPPYEPYRRRSSSSQNRTASTSPARDPERFPFPPQQPSSSNEPEESDSDSEPNAMRPVRVVALPRSSWRDKFPAEALSRPGPPEFGPGPSSRKHVQTWKRRQWEVIPVVVRLAPTDGTPAFNAAPNRSPNPVASTSARATAAEESSPRTRSRLFNGAPASPSSHSAPQFVPLPASPSLGADEDPLPQRTAARSSSTSGGFIPNSVRNVMKANIYGKISVGRASNEDEEETPSEGLFEAEEQDARSLELEEIGRLATGGGENGGGGGSGCLIGLGVTSEPISAGSFARGIGCQERALPSLPREEEGEVGGREDVFGTVHFPSTAHVPPLPSSSPTASLAHSNGGSQQAVSNEWSEAQEAKSSQRKGKEAQLA